MGGRHEQEADSAPLTDSPLPSPRQPQQGWTDADLAHSTPPARAQPAATPMQIAPTTPTTAAATTQLAATPAADNNLKRKGEDETDAATAATASASAAAPSRGGGRGGAGGGNKRGRGGRGGRGGGYSNRSNEAAATMTGAEDAESSGAPSLDGSASAASASASGAVSALPSAPLTPLQHQFQLYASYLDHRNDRRELVYVASRELTRASKKLISALQRCTQYSTADRTKLLASARSQQLSELHRMVAATVADLTPDESFRLQGAYSPGFQEFVEAASFLHYLEQDTAAALVAEGEGGREETSPQQPQLSGLLTHAQLEADLARTLGHRVSIPLSDYLVGLTDLGGELMRYATNSVTSGDRSIIARICIFLREVYALFQGLSSVLPPGAGPYKEMGKKLEVWMQSLVKIETLSYRLHIRGAEMPPNLLSAMLANDARGGGGGGGYDEGGGAGGGDGQDE